MERNSEGYKDPTANAAIEKIVKEEHIQEVERMAVISGIITVIKKAAELVGFEVVGRIVLKDKRTGKVYR